MLWSSRAHRKVYHCARDSWLFANIWGSWKCWIAERNHSHWKHFEFGGGGTEGRSKRGNSQSVSYLKNKLSINIYKRGKDYTEKDKLGISGNRVLENRIILKGSLKQNIKHCAPHGAQLQRWQGWWESFWLGVQGMNRRLECNELQTSVERRQHGSLTMTLFVHMNFPIC